MAEVVEDILKSEVDTGSKETVEGETKTESSTSEADAVASISEAGDGSNAETSVGEVFAVEQSAAVEEEQDAVDTAAGIEESVELGAGTAEEQAADADDGGAVSEQAGADTAEDGGGENVVAPEAETDASKEVDETSIPAASAPSTTDEKPEPVEADSDFKTETERVEHVTNKADKAVISVETPPELGDVPAKAEANAAVIVGASATKSEASDAGAAETKTTQDVMQMAGNDELKFGVLIGLVRVGQLSNKDVVDSVLCLVSIFWVSSRFLITLVIVAYVELISLAVVIGLAWITDVETIKKQQSCAVDV